MSIELIILIVFACIVAIIVSWAIGLFNMLVMAYQETITMLSNVKTEYQRRADLFYNLVESTKSYKKHEKETLVKLAQARSGNLGNTAGESIKKMDGLNKLFHKLMMVYENYPALKADTVHLKLMEEIRVTEDRINIARTDYNETVKDFNVLIKVFPNFIIANSLGYKDQPFFENEARTSQAPKISLE